MKKWSIYIFVMMMLAGCADEMPVIGPTDSEDNPGRVSLQIQFPDSGTPATYAIDTKAENKISRLDILSFTKGTGTLLDDKFSYHILISGDTITDVDANGRIKRVTTTLKSMTEEQRLVLIANAPSNINFTSIPEGTTMESIVDMLRFSGNTWRPPVATTDTTSFPMFGQMTAFLKIHSSNSTNLTNPLKFNMIRSVAKIDVGVDMYGTGDPALGFGSIFKIKNVHVYNASDSGFIAPHDDYLIDRSINDINDGDTIISKINILGSPTTTEKRVARIDYTFPANERGLINTIYLPETDTLKVTSGSNYKPAYVVIEASYMGNPSTFYRIDFTDGDKYVPILRNHHYVVNITGIRTEGYSTLAEAAAAPESRRNNALILDTDDDRGINEIISYNNEYYLGVSATDFMVDWNTETAKVYIKTSYAGGWKVTEKSFTGVVSDRLEYTVGRPTVLDSVTFNIGSNTTGVPKNYTLTVKAGMLTQKISVTQSPGSNSYILQSGGTITIPLSSADIDGKTINGVKRSTLIKKLGNWNNGASVNVSFSGGTITASADPTSVGGNTFILAEDIDGNVIWGWLVWLLPAGVDFDNPTYQRYNNGFIFMDRNLGAYGSSPDEYTHGNYYQWGRKDPLPFDFATQTAFTNVVTPVSYTNNLDTAFCNPKVFYTTTTYPYDWIGTDAQSQNNNLWATASGEKGVYDPCPFGWRVPVVANDNTSPWKDFTSNTRNNAVYPLAGGGDFSSGSHVDKGTQGYVWGASARGTNAFVFKFTGSSGSAEQTQAFRANAYPVRCVKDTK